MMHGGETRYTHENSVTEGAFPLGEALRLAGLGSWHWHVAENRMSWSDSLCRIYGISAARAPRTYRDYIALGHPDDRARVEQVIEAALRDRAPFEFVQRIVRPDATMRQLVTWGEVHPDSHGSGDAVLGICRDVTEPRKRERVSDDGDERLNMLVANVRDYGIFTLSPTGEIVSWNEGARRIKGYSKDEVCGRHFSCFYPPEAREAGMPERQLHLATLYGQSEIEGWRIRKDGSRFWASVVITALYDDAGRLRGFGKVVRDLTTRKRAEERRDAYAKSLHHLFRRVIDVQEEERRRIASEVHNGLGQSLAALKLQLQRIQFEPAPDAATALASCGRLVEQMIGQIRNLPLDPHPLTLHDLGLEQTLTSHIRAQFRGSGITAKIRFDDVPRHLPEYIATACFRVSQEAATNVLKHSGASELSVSVAARDGALDLTISDDGAGFEVDELEIPMSGSPRFGLIHMRERTTVVGGRFEIDSASDRGTTVRAKFPLRQAIEQTENRNP